MKMIKIKRGISKWVVGVSLICLVKIGSGLGLLGKEGDYEYNRRTFYDEYGQLTGLYESIRIPAVTIDADGQTIVLTPEYFAERFFRPEKLETNEPLRNILTNNIPSINWDSDFDKKELKEEIRNTPRQIASSFGSLNNFMNSLGVSERYIHCQENVLEPIQDFDEAITKLEKSFDRTRKELRKIDEKGDLIDQIKIRQKLIAKTDLLIESKKELIHAYEDWNRSPCGQRGRKIYGLTKINNER